MITVRSPQTSSVFGSSVVGDQMVLVAVRFGGKGFGSGGGYTDR
jgi:hypothetical protein